MKKKIYIVVVLLCSQVFLSGSIVDPKKIFPENKLFTHVANREVQLAALLQEKQNLEVNKDGLVTAVQKEIVRIGEQMEHVQKTLLQDNLPKESIELWNKILVALNELYHSMKTYQSLRERVIELVKQQIDLLENYLKDPEFTDFENNWSKIGEASFDVLRRLHSAFLDKKRIANSIVEQERIALIDLEHRKKTAATTVDAYKKIKNQREVLQTESSQVQELQWQLWDIEDALFENKKLIDGLNIKEAEYLIELYKIQRFINRKELRIIKDILHDRKSKVCIGITEVAQAKKNLEDQRQESFAIKRKYDQEKDALDQKLKSKQKKLASLVATTEISLGQSLDQWVYEPIKTVRGYEDLVKVGFLNSYVHLLQNQKQELQAHLADEDKKVQKSEIVFEVQETFYKICAHKFTTDEELAEETKKYDSYIKAIKASSISYQSRIKELDNVINARKEALAHIQELREDIEKQKDGLFLDHKSRLISVLAMLKKAEENIKADSKVLDRIRTVYNNADNRFDTISKLIEFIVVELGPTTIWHRPEYAVSWEGVSNIGPDMLLFLSQVQIYVTDVNVSTLYNFLNNLMSKRVSFLLLILILLLFCVFNFFLPSLIAILSELNSGNSILLLSFIAFLSFIRRNFFLLLIGLGTSAYVYLFNVKESSFLIVLYLLAIPYLIVLVHQYIVYMLKFNESHDYYFLARDFQQRFAIVFQFLAYSTIIILLFRKAFLLGNYYQSELPTILLAIIFIILQISLISLISKNTILSAIPEGTEFWESVRSLVNRYYFLIFLCVITIIILMNPYVGFLQLVYYVFKRCLYTFLLLVFMAWLQTNVRKMFSQFFFATDYDVIKERFPSAKKWYGFFMIAFFFAMMMVSIIFIAKIWEWPDWLTSIHGWSDIETLLKEPLRAEQQVGAYEGVSIWNLIIIMMYIFGGVVASFIFRQLILKKTYDIFLVDVGVQNTITSISYYIIFFIAAILGFNAANLSWLVIGLLGAMALSIGFVIKDPVLDLIAYFIILVQRPLKVGDYVKLDETISGVVRKINPRAVVLRHKNSTSIVIPNSMIINKPIINWNYTRGFIAFSDITIIVAHGSDVVKVREVMHKVLSENPSILKNPRPVVRLDEICIEGYKFTLRGYLNSRNTLDQWDIAGDIRIAMLKEFATNDIRLAIPVRFVQQTSSQFESLYDRNKYNETLDAQVPDQE